MHYAIISDIHANRTALKAVEEDVRRYRDRKGVDLEYWFLGDLVGYGPGSEAMECVRWLMDAIQEDDNPMKVRWIPGNHDEWIVNQTGELSTEARTTLTVQRDELRQPQNAELWDWYVAQVNAAITDEQGSLVFKRWHTGYLDFTAAFVHASVAELNRRGTYLQAWLPALIAGDLRTLRLNQHAKTLCLFCGHTHFPIMARMSVDEQILFDSIKYGRPIPLEQGTYAINPGSVGQPRDGDPRAAYLILDTERRAVEFRRVEYDVQVVTKKLASEKNKAGRQQALAQADLVRQNVLTAGGDPRLAEQISAREYEETLNAYDSLKERLQTGDGRLELQNYHTVYRVPEFDLIAAAQESVS